MTAYTVKTIRQTGTTEVFSAAIDTYMDGNVTNLDAFFIYQDGGMPVCMIVHH